jgi:hypothetical protein
MLFGEGGACGGFKLALMFFDLGLLDLVSSSLRFSVLRGHRSRWLHRLLNLLTLFNQRNLYLQARLFALVDLRLLLLLGRLLFLIDDEVIMQGLNDDSLFFLLFLVVLFFILLVDDVVEVDR